MPVSKECEHCHSQFTIPVRRSEKVRFCSRECLKAYSRVNLTCRHCGNGFSKPRSAVPVALGGTNTNPLPGQGRFCSKVCTNAARITPGTKGSKYREKIVREPVIKTCVVCAKEFRVTPNRAETAKACSNECAVAVRAKSRSRRKIRLSCANCGKAFEERVCHADRRVYCSRECMLTSEEYRQACRESSAGENNPMWNGGRTVHSGGYIYKAVYGHPFLSLGNYVFEHRLAMEQRMREECPDHPFLIEIDGALYLRPGIQVHHKDEDKQNNAPDNLVAVTAAAHQQFHAGKMPAESDYWPNL